jgi:hypothetical protein
MQEVEAAVGQHDAPALALPRTQLAGQCIALGSDPAHV